MLIQYYNNIICTCTYVYMYSGVGWGQYTFNVEIQNKYLYVAFRWFYVAWLIISKVLILTQAVKGMRKRTGKPPGIEPRSLARAISALTTEL